MKREKCVHCKYDRHIYRQKDIDTLLSKEQLMVMMVDFLNSIRDSYSIKEQKIARDVFNEFFEYYLKYNRTGIAGKIMQMQKKLNIIPK